jgi:phosphoribosylglycinamide formyltransferase 2
VVQNNNPTLFCALLVIVKNAGLSRKLAAALISDKDLYEAQDMAEKSYQALGWTFGVEFFWLMMGFTFRIPSPTRYRYGYISRNTNFNEFELHLRAILSLPILKLP